VVPKVSGVPSVVAPTSEQIRQFREQGFFTTVPLFSPEECGAIAAEYENIGLVLPLGEERDGKLDYQPMLHLRSPLLERYARDGRLIALAAPLAGGDLRLYWEQAVTKPPHARTELPWHQDNGYAPTEPAEYVTCWLALEDATLENGCIWVLPGSHRNGPVRHRMADRTFRTGWTGNEPGVAAPVPSGAVLVFSSLLFHRSGPNVTDRTRRAWILQYCPAHAIHAKTREPLTDRLLITRNGVALETPVRERPIDVARVYAEWADVDPLPTV
jgi:ectoine hydroxylase-related dioxygenase (phytanoyl-CoA dioxygenase family)